MNLHRIILLLFILTVFEIQAQELPRYKLYPTENMWTFLKLDTSIGGITVVQYSVEGEEYRFESPILESTLLTYVENDSTFYYSLIGERGQLKSGRFELYPTQNMYNFILLDQELGKLWQVQWESENRFVLPIKNIFGN